MKTKKHLSFNSLRVFVSKQFNCFPDWRMENKSNYSIHDAMMSGFACMYFQSPSLLQFQKDLEKGRNNNNLRTLFGVSEIPENTQLRSIIDQVDSECLRPIFKEFLARLQRGKQLEQYRFIEGKYLCSLDGTQFFSSNNLGCSQCLSAKHENGEVTNSHKAVQAAIVHPDMKQVLPLMPEEIVNIDGTSKQDCEINATKRWIAKTKKDHPRLPLILNVDGLYSKEPFFTEATQAGYSVIAVAKPNDHKYLMEWIDAFESLPSQRWVDKKGKIHQYEWVNHVPLNGKTNALQVNFFRFRLISVDKNGQEKITSQNSWVTDIEVNKHNIEQLVKGARSRWKIENECFNTLKNQGYHLEHNFGHGHKHLSFNIYLLILLAFYFHQIFELTDGLYQSCRKGFGSKRHMWEKIRTAIGWFIFESWEMVLDFVMEPEKYLNPRLLPPD